MSDSNLRDGSGNPITSTANAIDVNIKSGAAGGGSGSNAAASATGAAVPASADYTGFNSGGNLVGVSAANPLPTSLASLPALVAGSAVIGHVINDASTAVIGHVVVDSATLAAETTKVIGTVNVAAAQTIGLVAGAAVIGHVIADSGSTTAVTGNVTVVQPTGTNLHIVVDAAPSTAVTNAGTFATQATLVAETTKVIGTVNVAAAQTIAVTNATAANLKVDLSGTAANATAIKTDGSAVTQPVSQATAASLNATVVQGAANAAANAWPAKVTDGTNITAVKAASTAVVATDPSLVVQISPNTPTIIVNEKPVSPTGAFRLSAQTGIYAGLAAGSILFSARWGAASLAVITRITVVVNTTTAATVAGTVDRDLVIVRGFTVSDTGGTALTITGNNQKQRTSLGTSAFTNINIATTAALAAGTGTADAQATGLISKASTATEPIGTTLAPYDLFSYIAGQNYPIVLAQNEGIRVRIPTAQPTTIAQRTTVTMEWLEVAAF